MLVLVQMLGVSAARPQGRRCRVGCAVAGQGDRLIAGRVGCWGELVVQFLGRPGWEGYGGLPGCGEGLQVEVVVCVARGGGEPGVLAVLLAGM